MEAKRNSIGKVSDDASGRVNLADVPAQKKMTEREKLQASLRQTLSEFKQQQAQQREKRNG